MAPETPDTPLAPWPGRAILHADLDAFFAAVEQLDHPEWRGEPVIVGGDPSRRGVVSTASYEARRFGVRSAMSSARAAQLCPDAIWTHGSFERYRELSAAVFAIYRDESPLVQPLSIDEAFLDVTPGRFHTEHPVLIARRIRARVAQLGLTVSIGLASSKTVAKIGSDFEKPDGLTVVWPGAEAAFLAPLPVRAMSGVGPKTAERLGKLGLHTLGDLAALDDATALSVLGSHGPELVRRSRGIDERPVHENEGVKSVSNERTFSTDIRRPEEVDAALSGLAAKVGSRLRKKGLAGRTVSVKVRFSDFSTRTLRKTIGQATDDETVFEPVARTLVREAWSPGVGVRLLGVGVSGFDTQSEQLALLSDDDTSVIETRPQRRELVRGIDAVREKFGPDAIRFGGQLPRGTGTPNDAGEPSDAEETE
jgi:DNA polymerase-4